MAGNAAHVGLYVSRELRAELERLAAQNDRSLSAEARIALRAHTSSDPSATAASSPSPRVAEGKGV
jgi:hypothetical protein